MAVRLLRAAEAGPADVLAAEGYLFATPENLAAWRITKDFFDRCYYPALGASGTALRRDDRAAAMHERGAPDRPHRDGWRLRAVAEPVILCTRAQTPEAILAPKPSRPADLARCEELGAGHGRRAGDGVF
jgi:hypothetical protein